MEPTLTQLDDAKRKRNGRLLILSAALLWSLSGVVTKSLALEGATIAFYRGLFAGAALLPFVPKESRRFHPAMLPLALIFGAMTGLYLAAVQATTAANAIVLQYTSSFWTIPLSFLFLRERPDKRAVVGIAIGMVGIAVVVLGGHSGKPEELRGIAMSLGSGLAYAAVVVGLRGLRSFNSAWLMRSIIWEVRWFWAFGSSRPKRAEFRCRMRRRQLSSFSSASFKWRCLMLYSHADCGRSTPARRA